MFGVKRAWRWGKLHSAIEGVIREADNGHGTAVRQWYWDYLTMIKFLGDKEKLSKDQVLEEGFRLAGKEKAARFRQLEQQLTQPGELLSDLLEY